MELHTRRPPDVRPCHRRGAAAGRRGAAWLLVSGLAAGLALALPASAWAAGRGTIGGPQLAGHGVIVNYPAARAKPLPKVKASAYVIADAGTGQVLAAKDPPGWDLPAGTLQVPTPDPLN